MKTTVIVISTFLFILFSCNEENSSIGFEPGPAGSYSYLAYDSLGTPVVSGWLKFEHSDSVKIEGTWQLEKLVNRDDLGPHSGEGELVGQINNFSITMELNPQFVDNNLRLAGTISDNYIDGKWYWISFVGITNWGNFKAKKN
jgi:hypothetical protein